MNNKTLSIVVAVLVVVVGGWLFLGNKPIFSNGNNSLIKNNLDNGSNGSTMSGVSGVAENAKGNLDIVQNNSASNNYFSLSDVSKHADSTSCWTAINGQVYDVTFWIKQHPGGERAILGLCGKDGSSAFDRKHGGQARPESELAKFVIGKLK